MTLWDLFICGFICDLCVVLFDLCGLLKGLLTVEAPIPVRGHEPVQFGHHGRHHRSIAAY